MQMDPNLYQVPEGAEILQNGTIAGENHQKSDVVYMEKKFQIYGIDCVDSAKKLIAKLKSHQGVVSAELNFALGLLTIAYICPEEEIIGFIEANGYGVNTMQDNVPQVGGLQEGFWFKLFFIILAILFMLAGFIGPRYGVNPKLAEVFFPAAMFLGGFQFYRAAWNSIKNLMLDTSVFITLASIGALFFKKWPEAALMVLIYSIGRIIQTHTIDKSRSFLRNMLLGSPQQARLLQYGNEEIIEVDQLKVGDTVLIKPEEYVTADGEVISGVSMVNQVAITGDAAPLEKGKGDKVFAGSINMEGTIEVKVNKLAKDSTLARMIHMVDEAQNKSQFISHKIIEYYNPAVLALAVLTALISLAGSSSALNVHLYKAFILFLLASPCAFSISNFVPLFCSTGNAARNGILIKDSASLKDLAQTKTIVFSKRGTLTTGNLTVAMLISNQNISDEEIFKVAAAIEIHSEHPIAKAIVGEAQERRLKIPESHSFIAYAGKGVRGRLGEQQIHIGSSGLIFELGISNHELAEQADELERAGFTVGYITREYMLMGLIALSDVIREDAGEIIERLKENKIKEILLMSGDREGTAANIAGQLGIEYKAELQPQAKAAFLSEYAKTGVTVMVGDRTIDAPILASATVGIAIGAKESDEALENADVAFMEADLKKIPSLIQLGAKTRGIINQNMSFVIGFKLFFILLTLFGVTNLWVIVLADLAASLLVALNGFRLARFEL